MYQSYGLDVDSIETKFKGLENDVKLAFFTQETNCVHCNLAKRVFERITSIDKKVTFDYYNVGTNDDKYKEYGILAVPALAIIGARDYGIRYYGYPRGIEIGNFLDDVVYVSCGKNTLSETTNQKLHLLEKEIRLKIFITPECTYSLPAARLGLKLAVASDNIRVDIIDSGAFLELSETYGVHGIPMTIVNEERSIFGALEEEEYFDNILKIA